MKLTHTHTHTHGHTHKEKKKHLFIELLPDTNPSSNHSNKKPKKKKSTTHPYSTNKLQINPPFPLSKSLTSEYQHRSDPIHTQRNKKQINKSIFNIQNEITDLLPQKIKEKKKEDDLPEKGSNLTGRKSGEQ